MWAPKEVTNPERARMPRYQYRSGGGMMRCGGAGDGAVMYHPSLGGSARLLYAIRRRNTTSRQETPPSGAWAFPPAYPVLCTGSQAPAQISAMHRSDGQGIHTAGYAPSISAT